MSELFKIYIDRLKDGQTLKIEETTSPAFLDVQENDLAFTDPVKVAGESYLADDHLVVHLKIETTATLPCSVCNEKFKIPVVIDDFYHAEPIKELRTPTFDFTPELRETILVQVPPFAECHEGKCPEREFISKYLKTGEDKPPTKFPFENLPK